MVSGFGFGSAFFTFLITFLINPSNQSPVVYNSEEKYFDYEISEKFPSLMRVLSVIYLVLTVVGLVLLAGPGKNGENKLENEIDNECPSVLQGILTKSF